MLSNIMTTLANEKCYNERQLVLIRIQYSINHKLVQRMNRKYLRLYPIKRPSFDFYEKSVYQVDLKAQKLIYGRVTV